MIERSGYRVRDCDVARARELGAALGIGDAAAQVLLQRGHDSVADARAWLEPSLKGLTPPAAMIGRTEAADRIADAIRRNERIAIFGDYDVDGTTSTAILSDIIEALGGDVHPFIANRFEGGYGFSGPALERCMTAEPSLIITCDCGSSDHPRIADARARGVDVVVVDHHLVPDEPLPAVAFLNPHQPGCGFDYKWLCSAGLAFSLGAAVRASLGAKLDLRPWLDLVALGTVADVMPLDGDNRRLVRAGLKLLASPNARAGVTALRENARLKPGMPVGGQDIAFRLAPRLNAAGRLGDPTLTLELLRAREPGRARMLAARIEQINDERKMVERRVTEAAIAQVLEIYGERPEHGVVVAGKGWHKGVVGISAARVVDRFDVPAVVIGIDDDGSDDPLGHGSGRTPDGYHLHAAFSKCASDLTKFGGHAAAAGLSLHSSRLDAFRSGFADATPRLQAESELPVADVEIGNTFGLPSVPDLLRLEPFGEGNPAPVFAVQADVRDARAVGADGAHLKLILRVGRQQMTAFYGNQGALAEEIPARITALGAISPDTWRGNGAVELSVQELV